MTAPSKKIYYLIIVSWLAAMVVFLLVRPAGAQGLDVGTAALPLTGLGNPDIRVVVASVIKVILGLVGILVFGLGVYGGFVYMTARGDVEKILQARRILANAIIGLAIVLSAYTLTVFIISRLSEATGAIADDSGVPGGGGGGFGADSFIVTSITPRGSVPLRNIIVRLTFNRNVEPTLVQENIKVAGAAVVAGIFNVDGAIVEFTPLSACPDPNADKKCFDADTFYTVTVATGLRSLDNKPLRCDLGGSCSATFTSGNLVDAQAPQVSLLTPVDGQAVSVDSNVLLQSTATDDSGIARVDYLVDGNIVDFAGPPTDPSPKTFDSTGVWSTSGLTTGVTHFLKVTAQDIDTNKGESREISVVTRAAHCFNSIQDQGETGLDCGGSDCGICGGGQCTQNSDCSNGQCLAGQCVALPQISSLSPADGAPGNWITVRGANFGARAGSVVFLGNAADPADDATASLASCVGAWSATEVIVQVPTGAISGPIKLTTSDAYFDTTNDDKGSFKGDFIVNSTLRPGLCSVAPSLAEPGAAITLSGKNFGTTQSEVWFGDTRANEIGPWSATIIRDVIVPSLQPGYISVQVAVGNERSNPVAFQVKSSVNAPFISFVNPVAGPVGQYVTVNGSNFGSSGAVKFVNQATGVETLADINFPQICGINFWHNDYILVKVPQADVGAYKIKVIKNNLPSNLVDFQVNNSQPTPGVCKMDPDNGPVGTVVNVYGENFGSSQGKVRFFDTQDGQISAWASNSVSVTVPVPAKTGPVALVNSSGTLSNSVLFNVGPCSVNSCGIGEQCCSDGACRVSGQCLVVAPMCKYQWTFSTGALVTVSESNGPHVVEKLSCDNGSLASPTPAPDSREVCNANILTVSFDKEMDTSTYDSAASLMKCNQGAEFDFTSCAVASATVSAMPTAPGQNGGLLIIPSAALETGTWYSGKVSTLVKDKNGIALEQDYIWKFKTRSVGTACSVGSVNMVPSQSLLTSLGAVQSFSAYPQSSSCNVLNPTSYSWTWLSSLPSIASLGQIVSNTAAATALAETGATGPAKISASILSEGKTGTADLVIKFGNPRVLDYWPKCSLACTNAKLSVSFDNDITLASAQAPGALKLFSCDDFTCNTLTAVPITSMDYNNKVLNFYTSSNLSGNKAYRVVLMGGRNGVLGVGGALLDGLNYSSAAGQPLDSFSWTFKTQGSICAIDHVGVTPTSARLSYIGGTQNYSADVFSAPDACSAAGQPLNNLSFNWVWLSKNTNVGSITNFNVLPVNAPDTNIDPQQIATGTGPGSTKIHAETNTLSAEGDISLVCGYTSDNQCPLPSGGPVLETYAVGQDTCCSARPRVVTTYPTDLSTSICRNALITLSFNQLMQINTLAPNILLDANYGATVCPTTNGVQSLPLENGVNWCRLPVSILSQDFQNTTRISLEPGAYFDPTRQYRLRIQGDTNLQDAIKTGVLSARGIVMNGNYEIKFTTGPNICRISSVDISIVPQITGQSQHEGADLFVCAGRNDCPDDINATLAGDQHSYMAQAKDESFNPLQANYTWDSAGVDNVFLSATTGASIFVTSQPTNGTAQITVIARGDNASLGNASKTQIADVFLCENPWPDITTFPYTDQDTNFSLFYCRDGDDGAGDPLPTLVPSFTKPSDGTSLKEFLFIVK